MCLIKLILCIFNLILLKKKLKKLLFSAVSDGLWRWSRLCMMHVDLQAIRNYHPHFYQHAVMFSWTCLLCVTLPCSLIAHSRNPALVCLVSSDNPCPRKTTFLWVWCLNLEVISKSILLSRTKPRPANKTSSVQSTFFFFYCWTFQLDSNYIWAFLWYSFLLNVMEFMTVGPTPWCPAEFTIVHWLQVTSRLLAVCYLTSSQTTLLSPTDEVWNSPGDWLGEAQSLGRGVRFQFVETFCWVNQLTLCLLDCRHWVEAETLTWNNGFIHECNRLEWVLLTW